MNIEEKTKLAHEWYMSNVYKTTHEKAVVKAWQYTDAMEAEAEKRIKAKAEKDAKVFFEKLTKNEDGSCKHFHTTLNRGECFDCGENLNITDSSQLEWQPDWSVAPKHANIWQKSSADNYYWYCGDTCLGVAPSFNYQGDWKQSLRKRP